MKETAPLLKSLHLTVGYNPGSNKEKAIAGPMELEMYAGKLVSLLGPNGAGKSTLLRTLAGLQPSLSGTVEIQGENAARFNPVERAKKLSLVLTGTGRPANLNVYSLISLGRYPYTGWLGKLSTNDKEIIQQAIEATGVQPFLNRKIDQLSDGEAQKVMIARALAQDTPLIILDEPTAHLDLPNRIELMRMLHRLTTASNKGILISTHDLDLALQVSDEIWVLKADGEMHKGAPEDMVLNGTFEAAFDRVGNLFDKATGTFNIHQPGANNIHLVGEGAAAFWTKRALHRQHFQVNTADEAAYTIKIFQQENKIAWVLEGFNKRQEHSSIASLLTSLTEHKQNKNTANKNSL
jgi:iron complex transport system ATP-binding protein